MIVNDCKIEIRVVRAYRRDHVDPELADALLEVRILSQHGALVRPPMFVYVTGTGGYLPAYGRVDQLPPTDVLEISPVSMSLANLIKIAEPIPDADGSTR